MEHINREGTIKADQLFEEFRKWRSTPDCFDTGNVFLAVFQAAKSMPREMAARNFGAKSAGPNAAHRGAPVALLAGNAPDIAEMARRQAELTHVNAEAVFLAQLSALICWSLIRNPEQDVLDVAREMAKTLPNVPKSFQSALKKPKQVATNGGYAPEVFAAALLFCHEATDFGEALGASIAFAGPSNYCPVLVGQYLGSKFGSEAIGPVHLKHLDHSLLQRYTEQAKTLAQSSTKSQED